MKTLDTSQFANQKGQSMDHYLMMIDKILRSLDGASKGEANAALVTLEDFSKAFDRQDATLAVKSFQDNGVRPSLIPLLISFFERRQMTVKWHGVKSGLRDLPGGSPQGASLGLWSFLSQTNDNLEDASCDEIYKFVDDKSVIEVINLFSIGLASHNLKATVPSNIPVSNNFIPREHLKTQSNLERVERWAKEKQMKLNVKKTKNICFNFTKDKQFSTDIKLNNESIETVSETKLLGTIITNDLKWNKNTDNIVKETNKRMQILHKATKFTNNIRDLKQIYMLQIRSKLDQSAIVWHSSLSQKNRNDLERVQKSALRCILGDSYRGYKDALEKLGLMTLEERRKQMCFKFAKQCLKLDKMKKFFPRNKNSHAMEVRSPDFYKVGKYQTERFKKSAIPFMIKMLNDNQRETNESFKKLHSIVPVNHVCTSPYHCDNNKL